MAFGQQTTTTTGGGTPASADGRPEYKPGGVTIDWSTVPANAAAATLADGSVIPAGVKYLPYGLILTRITASGKYGPHDAGAADGRQTPARGGAYIVNHTTRADDLHADNPPGVFDGGRVYIDRLKLLAAGVYTNTGAWAAGIQAVFPRVSPADPDL
jgi:hypothetical protein